jgi:hypothetical protein
VTRMFFKIGINRPIEGIGSGVNGL